MTCIMLAPSNSPTNGKRTGSQSTSTNRGVHPHHCRHIIQKNHQYLHIYRFRVPTTAFWHHTFCGRAPQRPWFLFVRQSFREVPQGQTQNHIFSPGAFPKLKGFCCEMLPRSPTPWLEVPQKLKQCHTSFVLRFFKVWA